MSSFSVSSGLSGKEQRRIARREMLRRGAAIAVGACGVTGRKTMGAEITDKASASQKNADTKNSGAIDAHVHVWTPDTQKYPLAAGYRRDEMKPASFTPDELWKLAKPCGVSRVVLVQMSFYGFDNSYMLDCIRESKGAFAGIAVIDDSQPKPQDEMQRLKELGVRGFRIYPRNLPADRWLDSPGMQAMWEAGAKLQQAMCCLVNPEALPAIDRMCEKYPETPLVVDHFARIGVDGQTRDADIAKLCRLARHKNSYVKVSAYYALGKKQSPYTDLGPMIRRLVEAYGPQRLMWATDCPYQVQEGHKYCDSIDLIRERLDFLKPEDRQWILRGTAEKVFFGA